MNRAYLPIIYFNLISTPVVAWVDMRVGTLYHIHDESFGSMLKLVVLNYGVATSEFDPCKDGDFYHPRSLAK